MACVTITKLLCGCSSLRMYSDFKESRQHRICNICQSDVIEDVFKFFDEYDQYCQELLDCIERFVIVSTWRHFNLLSTKMKCLLLLGLNYSFNDTELQEVRRLSAYYMNTMYRRRHFLGRS